MILAEKIILSLFFGGVFVLFLQLYDALLLKPRSRRLKLQIQGIKGPIPSLMYGNIAELKRIQLQKRPTGVSVEDNQFGGRSVVEHAWISAVFPHIEQWRREYGPTFMYSTGNIQILCVTDPEMVKEISLCTSWSLGKPSYLSTERGPLLGRGILSSNGHYWDMQRKIISPEFYLERVKGFVTMMAESTSTMLKTWESKAETWGGKVEIRVDEDLRSLSADIISRSCFGSNYAEGEKIFTKLQTLLMVMSKGNIGIPGLRYLPNRHNKEIWKLEKEIDSTILGLVERRSEDTCGKDLLQLILSAAKSYGDDSNLPADITPNKFIVDNCKNIYFAGHETTAISASWCLMLLAAHPEWQARARAEVLEICGMGLPAADTLRSCRYSSKLENSDYGDSGDTTSLPPSSLCGVNIQIPIPILHQDPDLWHSDVHQFNPERFADGTAGACKIAQAYMPFGLGSRTCAGQHFAMAELKVILSLILSKFSFSLSLAYQHSPVFRLVIQPEHGVNLQFEKL
ncbi:unnamed protein product [Fraxinus pennsylvanica]|uniref:Cytochrome P450 n=1 Tax=Fraxinus pennsylvanica TaxID=56036 RepID=A0AAD2AAK4_9LAMI|nr:unnamed protein product [Fraxinus pennsylvanica]